MCRLFRFGLDPAKNTSSNCSIDRHGRAVPGKMVSHRQPLVLFLPAGTCDDRSRGRFRRPPIGKPSQRRPEWLKMQNGFRPISQLSLHSVRDFHAEITQVDSITVTLTGTRSYSETRMTLAADLDLPDDIATELQAFVGAAQERLGGDLVSVVLFGSAAEGRLRKTSDVNLMLVLTRFDPARMHELHGPLTLAHAAIRLSTMLILESELEAAAESFAVKFADIIERHKVLAGQDVIARLRPTREAMIERLRQVLLNFILRTRDRYVLAGPREEQLSAIVADAAGPLRSAAALLLNLKGRTVESPKAALEIVATELDASAWQRPLHNLSQARETGALAPGEGETTLLRLLDLAERLLTQAGTLR